MQVQDIANHFGRMVLQPRAACGYCRRVVVSFRRDPIAKVICSDCEVKYPTNAHRTARAQQLREAFEPGRGVMENF